MQECTKPAALARTSTFRGCFGLTRPGAGVGGGGGGGGKGGGRGRRRFIVGRGAGAGGERPLGEGGLQCVAREEAALIQTARGEAGGGGASAPAATPAGGGLLCLQRE